MRWTVVAIAIGVVLSEGEVPGRCFVSSSLQPQFLEIAIRLPGTPSPQAGTRNVPPQSPRPPGGVILIPAQLIADVVPKRRCGRGGH